MRKRLCLLPLLFAGCASYTDQITSMSSLTQLGKYDKALDILDKSVLAKNSGDKVLYHMERGTLLYLLGRFDSAARDWGAAESRAEELYTTSLSAQAAALSINESYADYEGEAFERVLLPVYSALAYLRLGSTEKAAAEVRKTFEVLEVINRQGKGKNSYSREGFAHHLSGLIYEARGDWDAAIIEYRAALADSASGAGKLRAADSAPIASALGRLAQFRRRREIVAEVRAAHPAVTWTSHEHMQSEGELYVLHESGRIPIKVAEDIVLPMGEGVVRISFPVYHDRLSAPGHLGVSLDGAPVGPAALAADFGFAAKAALSDRRAKDIARMVARAVLKDQAARAAARSMGEFAGLVASIAGAVTETADTRGWTGLPETLWLLRVPVRANKTVVLRLDPDRGAPQEIEVHLKPGEKKLVSIRTMH